MRELTSTEWCLVAGGHETVCTPASALNDYNGIRNSTSVGPELINIYEGMVSAASHIIERVAFAFD